jgi:hypothetical protein
MSPAPAKRFLYSGHTVGAAAHFHRLDDVENLDYSVPTLGASVLPVTGGLSRGHAADYCFNVDHPRHRTLLSVRRIDSTASGKEHSDRYETAIEADIESIHVVEKLHIDAMKLHLLSTTIKGQPEAIVSSNGNRIEGMRLGKVNVKVAFDEEPLGSCGSKARLAAFYNNQSADYKRDYGWRYQTDPVTGQLAEPNGHYVYSLVRDIQLDGPEEEMQAISKEGYTIRWKGFGRLILGEVVVKGNNRQVTLVRLAMGSNAGGNGSIGCGQSNGQVGTN